MGLLRQLHYVKLLSFQSSVLNAQRIENRTKMTTKKMKMLKPLAPLRLPAGWDVFNI